MEFCAKCGRKGETIEGLCEKCYSEEHPSLVSFKDVKISVCNNCRRYLSKNRWIGFSSLKDIIKKVVKENIKGNKKIIVNPVMKDEKSKKVIGEVKIKVIGEEEEYIIPYEINYVTCPICSKKDSGYYEGILQLRDVNNVVVDYCLSDVKRYKEKGVFFTKVDEVKNGLDLYCSSKRYIISLGNKLKKKFKGEVKTSKSLFSRDRQRSKDVYRINVLFRLKL